MNRIRDRRLAFFAVLLAGLYFSAARGSEQDATGVWSFRNGFSGHFPNATPPLSWSSTENVAWHLALKKRANASPVIVGNKVFTLEEPSTLLCLDTSDGRILWSHTNTFSDLLGAAVKDRPALPRTDWLGTYGYTTPTPVSDGKRIWCVFGHGIVVCYDLDGNRQWFAEFNVADKISGVAVSPCLIDGVLIVGGKGDDRLCGFDADTGKKLWHTDEGTQEGSSVPMTLNGKHYAVASAGFLLDPQTGKILQRNLLGTGFRGDGSKLPVNWGPTVLIEGNVAYLHAHFQPNQFNTVLRAVKLDADARPEQLWEFYPNTQSDIRGRMGNSPLLFNGLLYAIKDSGMLQVFDATTGALTYEQQLPRHSYASLALAGPYIYALGGSIVTIFKPGRSFEQVARFKHGFTDFIASPVFENRRLYFRDNSGLWCIEAPATPAANPSPAMPATLTDTGPDLADTAKTAPLLSYSEWLLEYDQTRLPLRRFSLIFEWFFAALATALGIWAVRRAAARPNLRVLALFALVLGGLTPLLMVTDRVGNAYFPVGVWCIAGGLIAWKFLTQPPPAAAVRGKRPVQRAQSSLAKAYLLSWGWLLGGAAGLAIHHMPFQLAVMWYVLTGWQK